MTARFAAQAGLCSIVLAAKDFVCWGIVEIVAACGALLISFEV